MGAMFREFWADFRGMKRYVVLAAVIFVVGLVLGGSGKFDTFAVEQLKGFDQIREVLDDTPSPQLSYFGFIFLNNFIKSLVFVFFGFLFGVLPVFVLLVNGLILGFIVAKRTEIDGLWPTVDAVARGILPHGWIELPMIIIACAYGLRLGRMSMAGLVSVVVPSWRESLGAEFKLFFRMSVPLMMVLFVTLLIAALVESTVSFWLMES